MFMFALCSISFNITSNWPLCNAAIDAAIDAEPKRPPLA